MKKLFALAASAALLAMASVPSHADPVDMSTITCENLASMKEDEVSFVLIWVQGYMAGASEDSSMDPDVLGKSISDTATYCQANGSTSVMNARSSEIALIATMEPISFSFVPEKSIAPTQLGQSGWSCATMRETKFL